MTYLQRIIEWLKESREQKRLYRQIDKRIRKAHRQGIPALVEAVFFSFIKHDLVQEVIMGNSRFNFELNLKIAEPGIRMGNLEVYEEKKKVFDIDVTEVYGRDQYQKVSEYSLGEINGFIDGPWVDTFREYLKGRKEKMVTDAINLKKEEKKKKIQNLKDNFGIQ